jgi:hypothetical protein
MASTPEGRVKQAVKTFLRNKGIWFYMPVQNGMGQVGIPDFICCWKGVFLAIETKAPGKLNNTTPNQERVIKEIRSNHGYAFVVDSVELLARMLETIEGELHDRTQTQLS